MIAKGSGPALRLTRLEVNSGANGVSILRGNEEVENIAARRSLMRVIRRQFQYHPL
jgi:hypothetical protein